MGRSISSVRLRCHLPDLRASESRSSERVFGDRTYHPAPQMDDGVLVARLRIMMYVVRLRERGGAAVQEHVRRPL